ncbi:depupylase/deamidase Dop [Mariniluteicoccus endophyticus]
MISLFGLETEFGIAVSGEGPASDLHPLHWSNAVVRAYQRLTDSEAGWDYATEAPLDDARGFTVAREEAHPSQLTDDESMANLVIANGARLYVDHAHPEYSGPETTSAREAARFDAAGDRIAHLAATEASRILGQPLRLWKNNTDGKGQSYGTHENYLVARSTPFFHFVTQFTGFLVTRQVFTGAGRVGIGQRSETAGFQIAQRADFFEAEVGLETTLNRPVINTRDEPHADKHVHRRLHVITGDANQSTWQTWLKVGTAALVLRAIAAGECDNGWRPVDAVQAMHDVSHDLGLTHAFLLESGDTTTALGLQESYAEAVARTLDREGGTDEERELLAAWTDAIDVLRRDPMELADRLDWVAKRALMERYRERDGLVWDHPKLALVDLQYAELDPARSLFHALVRTGRMRTLFTEAEIEDARLNPPVDTRAYFRGELMKRHGHHVRAASWDSVILDVPGRRALLRLPMPDPLRGTREHVGAALAASADLADLVRRLGVD